MMIEEFKDELKDFKKILKLKLSREQEINEIKKWNKKSVKYVLDDEITDILEKFDLNLMTLKLRCKFCAKPLDFKKERELRLSAEENINEIKGLKEEVENKEDL